MPLAAPLLFSFLNCSHGRMKRVVALVTNISNHYVVLDHHLDNMKM